jgi:hypothetical protein
MLSCHIRVGGVTVADLADFADSPERGVGRFSYLPQSTLIQTITFIGAAQTGSHVRTPLHTRHLIYYYVYNDCTLPFLW